MISGSHCPTKGTRAWTSIPFSWLLDSAPRSACTCRDRGGASGWLLLLALLWSTSAGRPYCRLAHRPRRFLGSPAYILGLHSRCCRSIPSSHVLTTHTACEHASLVTGSKAIALPSHASSRSVPAHMPPDAQTDVRAYTAMPLPPALARRACTPCAARRACRAQHIVITMPTYQLASLAPRCTRLAHLYATHAHARSRTLVTSYCPPLPPICRG